MADPPLRVLSLFAGIGGLDLGFDAGCRDLGIATRHVGYVEREAFGAAVLAAAMERGELAPAPLWVGDVERFRPPAADVVLAGFPCPPVSCAGKRRGVDDDRWLWPEVVRVVQDAGASLVFLENVRGLLTANGGRAFGEVLRDLADLGFDAEWTVLAASDVGAPHRRERVFILAHREHAGRGERGEAHDARGRRDAPGHDAHRRDATLDDAEDADGRRGEPGEPGEPGERRRGSRGAGVALDVADADVRLEPQERPRDEPRGELAGGRRAAVAAGPRATGGDALADAVSDGGAARRAEPGDDGRSAASLDGREAMADAERCGRDGRAQDEEWRPQGRVSAERCGAGVADARDGRQRQDERDVLPGQPDAPRRGSMADARDEPAGAEHEQQRDRPDLARGSGFPREWPPGPGDRDGWAAILAGDAALAPALVADVRRVAHGVPEGLDGPVGRTDRLRALGNAVVPVQARAAVVTLWPRLFE